MKRVLKEGNMVINVSFNNRIKKYEMVTYYHNYMEVFYLEDFGWHFSHGQEYQYIEIQEGDRVLHAVHFD